VYHLLVVIEGSVVQCSPFLYVLSVYVSSLIEENLNALVVSLSSRKVNGSTFEVILVLYIGSSFDEG
jgi:hypothetical protein